MCCGCTAVCGDIGHIEDAEGTGKSEPASSAPLILGKSDMSSSAFRSAVLPFNSLSKSVSISSSIGVVTGFFCLGLAATFRPVPRARLFLFPFFLHLALSFAALHVLQLVCRVLVHDSIVLGQNVPGWESHLGHLQWVLQHPGYAHDGLGQMFMPLRPISLSHLFPSVYYLS